MESGDEGFVAMGQGHLLLENGVQQRFRYGGTFGVVSIFGGFSGLKPMCHLSLWRRTQQRIAVPPVPQPLHS